MSNLDARILKKMIKEVVNKEVSNTKLSNEYIKKLIIEELQECGMMSPEEADHGYNVDSDGYEGEMAKGNLFKAAEAATTLHNLFSDNEDLEPWVEEKIAIASDMLDTVADYIKYQKTKGGR